MNMAGKLQMIQSLHGGLVTETAPFYNYIYFTIAGFSEIDTFRSNQIREGMITRDEALHLSFEENLPRYEAIKWYLRTLNLDLETVINRINSIPKPISAEFQ